MMLKSLSAGLAGLCLLAGAARAADDPEVIFAAKPGEHFSYSVSYGRSGTVGGRGTGTTLVRYDFDVTIKSASPDGIVATVTNSGVDMSLDGTRMLTPPDFDSLLLLATDGLPADIELTPDGIVDKVADWDRLKAELTTRALLKAGNDETLKKTVETFLPTFDAVAAAEIFARPLAMSAPGRIVKLKAPDRTSVEAQELELPSFVTHAKSHWTFTLIEAPKTGPSLQGVTIEWLGVPDSEQLRAILATVAGQLRDIEPDDQPAFSVIEKDANMWQRFLATYAPDTGILRRLSGEMELRAGPIQRKVAIEANAKPE